MNERPPSIAGDLGSGLDGDQGPPILTVSEISGLLKRTVEETFSAVRVRGEISGFKRAQSGHLYFVLKDSDAVLDGVCWRGTAGRLGLEIEDGMEVLATGRITTYAARSRYQIVVESMELAGEGALLRLIEERRKRLDQEGLFDPEVKKPLPFLPDVIGVVTSPTGAVIRDILHRLDDRFPRRVLLWPVRVQGEGAAAEIAAVIDGFNRLSSKGKIPRPDVLIVARGGGGLEDLMAFNEEIVVRAVATSRIPLISAIGHETDWTLIDFAADERAPTPTAAAELVVPVRAELLAQVMDDGGRLTTAASRLLDDARIRLEGLARGLPNLGRVTDGLVQRLDEWSERLGNVAGVAINGRRAELARLAAALLRPDRLIDHAKSQLKSEGRALETAFKTLIRERRRALKQAADLLKSYSYERVLERGFVLVTDTQGLAVDSVDMLNPGMDVRLGFHDGKAGATVNEVKGPRGGSGEKKRRTRKSKPGSADSRQGKLL